MCIGPKLIAKVGEVSFFFNSFCSAFVLPKPLYEYQTLIMALRALSAIIKV